MSFLRNRKLKNKKLILGVCGGIAAYKSAELVRLLIKQGAEVQVVMTHSAQEFVSPLTFQALSGKDVRCTLFDTQAEAGMGHIELARWADLILIAPATANTIAKIAHGIADDLLATLCLATDAPLLIAPAMNQQMWKKEVTQENITLLSERQGIFFSGPAEGEQACGDNGPGRMEEPAVLLKACEQVLSGLKKGVFKKSGLKENNDLKGKRVLITAGPTIEDIDPVRYMSNRSSGKMGYAIAQTASDKGADVVLISGPTALKSPENIDFYSVRSAQQMHDAVFKIINDIDIFISTAAVADYRPIKKIDQKIKKNADKLTIELIKNPDILADVSSLPNKPITIGFAAETNDVEVYARDKLKRKNLDMIAANKVGEAEGFETDDNELLLFWHASNPKMSKKLPYASKKQLAQQLMNEIVLLFVKEPENTPNNKQDAD